VGAKAGLIDLAARRRSRWRCGCRAARLDGKRFSSIKPRSPMAEFFEADGAWAAATREIVRELEALRARSRSTRCDGRYLIKPMIFRETP